MELSKEIKLTGSGGVGSGVGATTGESSCGSKKFGRAWGETEDNELISDAGDPINGGSGEPFLPLFDASGCGIGEAAEESESESESCCNGVSTSSEVCRDWTWWGDWAELVVVVVVVVAGVVVEVTSFSLASTFTLLALNSFLTTGTELLVFLLFSAWWKAISVE